MLVVNLRVQLCHGGDGKVTTATGNRTCLRVLGSGFLLLQIILQDLSILLDFKNQTKTWDDVTILMQEPNTSIEDGYLVQESELVNEATERNKCSLDAK